MRAGLAAVTTCALLTQLAGADPVWSSRASAAETAFVSNFVFPKQKNAIVNTADDTSVPAEYWNIAMGMDTLTDGGSVNVNAIKTVYSYQDAVGWSRDVSGAGHHLSCCVTLRPGMILNISPDNIEFGVASYVLVSSFMWSRMLVVRILTLALSQLRLRRLSRMHPFAVF